MLNINSFSIFFAMEMDGWEPLMGGWEPLGSPHLFVTPLRGYTITLMLLYVQLHPPGRVREGNGRVVR